MSTWKVAAVQMDCRFGDPARNLESILSRLRSAAEQGARLVVFPECALTGYAFETREEAWAHAEPIPGPSTEAVAAVCRGLQVWACFGMLEKDAGRLFNACALVGPDGVLGRYRKVHMPCIGVDRFATPGDLPFAVHDLGGLRIGINICYDVSFPESSRVLALLGADLVVLPTNWPPEAHHHPSFVVRTRALENRIYYAAVNRVGEEGGFRFIGQSRIVDCTGEVLAAGSESEEILFAEIDPSRARNKQIVNIPGKYEVNRVRDRRPEMYRPICEPQSGKGSV
jgi:predicted amidohydrolase